MSIGYQSSPKMFFTPGHLNSKLLRFSYDVLVIFCSITLSLLFDEWREHRKERKAEQFYLLGLLKDLRKDIGELKADVAMYRRTQQGFAFYLRYDYQKNPYPDSLQHFLPILYNTVGLVPNNSRYEALKHTGKLDVLQNAAVLERLLEVYQEKIPTLLLSTNAFSDFKRDFLWPYLDSQSMVDAKGQGVLNWSAIMQDPRFKSYLQRAGSFQEIIERYQDLIGAEQTLQGQMEQELEGQSVGQGTIQFR